MKPLWSRFLRKAPLKISQNEHKYKDFMLVTLLFVSSCLLAEAMHKSTEIDSYNTITFIPFSKFYNTQICFPVVAASCTIFLTGFSCTFTFCSFCSTHITYNTTLCIRNHYTLIANSCKHIVHSCRKHPIQPIYFSPFSTCVAFSTILYTKMHPILAA